MARSLKVTARSVRRSPTNPPSDSRHTLPLQLMGQNSRPHHRWVVPSHGQSSPCLSPTLEGMMLASLCPLPGALEFFLPMFFPQSVLASVASECYQRLPSPEPALPAHLVRTLSVSTASAWPSLLSSWDTVRCEARKLCWWRRKELCTPAENQVQVCRVQRGRGIGLAR